MYSTFSSSCSSSFSSTHSIRTPGLWVAAIVAASLAAPVTASAEQVGLDVRLVNPVMKAGQKETNYLRISLTGFDMEAQEQRSPVNVAIVLDHSGSMQGDKLEQAKRAAITAVDRLSDQDIVSVVIYDSNVEVLVPATKAVDRDQIKSAIRKISAGSSTALFAGVSKGGAEVRKFLQSQCVNRVILLSDGLANVGPDSPQDLEGLGRSLMKEDISVTALGLGLGYNEDLMVALASVGGGNHAFIESADDLVGIFNKEFDGLLSVVANQFEIEVQLADSVRPVRMVGCDGDIEGRSIRIPLAQLYAQQERYFVVEVEVDPGESGTTRPVADVEVSYQNLQTQTRDMLASHVEVRFSESTAAVQSALDVETYAYCMLQLSNERNRHATALRDAGEVEKAQELLNLNAQVLNEVELQCEANGLTELGAKLGKVEQSNDYQARVIADESKWNYSRKGMRALQNSLQQQQTYSGIRADVQVHSKQGDAKVNVELKGGGGGSAPIQSGPLQFSLPSLKIGTLRSLPQSATSVPADDDSSVKP